MSASFHSSGFFPFVMFSSYNDKKNWLVGECCSLQCRSSFTLMNPSMLLNDIDQPMIEKKADTKPSHPNRTVPVWRLKQKKPSRVMAGIWLIWALEAIWNEQSRYTHDSQVSFFLRQIRVNHSVCLRMRIEIQWKVENKFSLLLFVFVLECQNHLHSTNCRELSAISISLFHLPLTNGSKVNLTGAKLGEF